MPGSGSSGTGSVDRKYDPAPGTGRGPLGHPAVLLLLAVAVLSGAYALGYLPEFGSLLEDAIHSRRSSEFFALNPVVYGVAGLVAFLLLLSLLRSFNMLIRRFRRDTPLANRPLKPLAQFIEEAAIGKISPRIARESYHLLTPHYRHLMCVDLADRLREDLLLSDEEVGFVEAQLLTRCDRRSSPDDAAEGFRILTVFDLMHHVETSALLRVDRPQATRARSSDVAPDLPIAQSRNPTSAQRKALHAAALLAIESRTHRVAETSGKHRRNSDYEGPRRRATDTQPEAIYRGPFRRATDRPTAEFKVMPLNQRTTNPPAGKETTAPPQTELTSNRPY